MTDESPDTISDELFAEDGWARSIARDLVHHAADADDMVQKLWLDVVENQPSEVRSSKAWIRGALRKIVSMERRAGSRRRIRESIAASNSPELVEFEAASDAREIVAKALDELKPPYREAIELRYLRDLDPTEIARILDVPAATVRKRIERGLDQMRSALEERFGKGASGWPMLLMPLLRVRNARKSSKASLTQTIGSVTPTASHRFGGKIRVAGAALVACFVLFFFFDPTKVDLPPQRTAPEVDDAVGALGKAPSKNATEVVVSDVPVAGSPSRPPVTSAASTAPKKHLISIEILIREGGAAVDAEILVEASRIGDYSVGFAQRRPLRLTPDESLPFETVGSGRGRSGQVLTFPVPDDGIYRMRISSEVSQNVVYASLPPNVPGYLSIELVRDPRLTVYGISDETEVKIRRDARMSAPSIAMQTDDGEDDEFRRARGPFFLPMMVDVALNGISTVASTSVSAQNAVLRLPAHKTVPCAVTSAVDGRPIRNADARSLIIGIDRTRWSIETRAIGDGTTPIVVTNHGWSVDDCFAQLKAPGYAMILLSQPTYAKKLRDALDPTLTNAPLDVRLAPEGALGGGRILDSDGVPVARGTIHILSDAPDTVIGFILADGRFTFEPLMNWNTRCDAVGGYRASGPFKGRTVSLLFDDESTAICHFDDVPVAELMSGTWTGRLPKGEATPIEFIDAATRVRIHPEQVSIFPLDSAKRPMGESVIRGVVGPRWPIGGSWLVKAHSLSHGEVGVMVDADRPIAPIEMTKLNVEKIEILVKGKDGPRPFQSISLYSPRGTKLTTGEGRTKSDGRLTIFPTQDSKTATYRLEGGDVMPSIHAPTHLESGGEYTIEVCPTAMVPISVVDEFGRPIEEAAAVIRRPDGGLGRGDTALIGNGKLALSNEPQQLVIMAQGFRPQWTSWSPGANGEATPIRVVMASADTVRFTIAEGTIPASGGTISVALEEAFDIGSPVPTPPPFRARLERSAETSNAHEFRAAPGKYRLKIKNLDDTIILDKILEVRGATDWGTIAIDR